MELKFYAKALLGCGAKRLLTACAGKEQIVSVFFLYPRRRLLGVCAPHPNKALA